MSDLTFKEKEEKLQLILTESDHDHLVDTLNEHLEGLRHAGDIKDLAELIKKIEFDVEVVE